MCTVRENVEKKDYRNRDSRPLRGFEASGSNLLLLATRGGDQAALRQSCKRVLLFPLGLILQLRIYHLQEGI